MAASEAEAKRIDELERALYDLLDTLERGDGFRAQERLMTAGRLLGLPRYNVGTYDDDAPLCAPWHRPDGTCPWYAHHDGGQADGD